VCAAAIVVLGGCAFIQKINKLTIDNVPVQHVKDGSYEGTTAMGPTTSPRRSFPA
jgi:hypothetical protein